MTAKTLNISSYTFRQTDELLIDANVWLYIYGPQIPQDQKSINYSNALTNILQAKCSVFIDVLILSEFINRYSRLKCFQDKGSADPNIFKSYRQSSDFNTVAKDITDAVRRIFKHSKCVESGFTSININDLLTDYESKRRDFNDQILVEICKSRSFKLVTHDGDFRDYDITILTANRNMLSNP
jgi:predicted nucleic acid-binding protein